MELRRPGARLRAAQDRSTRPTAPRRAARSTTAPAATRPGAPTSPARRTGPAIFRRAATDDAVRSAKELTAFARIGLKQDVTGGQRWSTVVPADPRQHRIPALERQQDRRLGRRHRRLPQRRTTPSAGWSRSTRTTRRRRRSSAPRWAASRTKAPGRAARSVGKPLAFYMGDDSRSEYVYKFVSPGHLERRRRQPGDRLATGDKYLDDGTLYAAKFNADGTRHLAAARPGQQRRLAATPAYAFADLADVLVNARLAADAAGATKMDRPEWTAVNPHNGEIYITMTENPDRGNVGTLSSNNVPNPDVDAGHPALLARQQGHHRAERRGAGQQGQRQRPHHAHARDRRRRLGHHLQLGHLPVRRQAKADAGSTTPTTRRTSTCRACRTSTTCPSPTAAGSRAPAASSGSRPTTTPTTTSPTACCWPPCRARYGDGGTVDVVNQANGKPGTAGTDAGDGHDAMPARR